MKRLPAILILTALLLIAGGAAFFWRGIRIEHRYDTQIGSAAQRYGVEPALVKAIVWRESRFNASARGGKAEIGLMQLQELAAQEWADSERIRTFEHEHCIDPATNTLAGTYYLSKLLRRYTHTDDPVPYALADYNAGRSNALKWMNGEAATNSMVFIEQIAFPMTKNYVKIIMERAAHYRPEFQPKR